MATRPITPPPEGWSLGELVRTWRERALLSQEELATRTGLGVRTIRRLESADGTRRPHGASVRRLAEALGLSEVELACLVTTARNGHSTATGKVTGSGTVIPAIPRQLPAGVAGFAGRAEQLRQLDALPRRGVAISVLAGTAGVGKTALAVHWAHMVADRFPDGQLYVNLRGYDASAIPIDPADAIGDFLQALGVPRGRLPADVDALATRYRSVLARRRVLIVLDNARDAGQVRPLLPGSQDCFVLVTSRYRLTGLLVAEAAKHLTLELMSDEDARSLLARRIGAERVAAEPQAVDRIIRLCAQLPLALAVAAAQADTRPGRSLATLADELGDPGGSLDVLDTGDPTTSVRQVLSWSYRHLSVPAATMFRRLGLHPGPEVSLPAATSLAGGMGRPQPVLSELARAHLLTEIAPGRFTCHDLLRAYAAELAHNVDQLDERRATLRRILDHYLYSSLAAAELIDPQRDLHAPSRAPVVTPERPGDSEPALDWLSREYPVLRACVTMAVETGFDEHAWHLAWVLPPFLDRRGLWRDWATIQTTALAAAERLADPPKLARSHRSLGGSYTQLGRWGQARDHLQRALASYGEVGDQRGQGHTHLDLDWLHDRQGNHRDALAHAELALEVFRGAGDGAGEARALNNVGWHQVLLGDLARGLDCCRRALDRHRDLHNRWGEACSWDSLGYAHHQLGQYREAIDCCRNALRLSRELGDRPNEAEALTHLGDAHAATGDSAKARHCWQQAVAILDQLGHPDADEVRSRLEAQCR